MTAEQTQIDTVLIPERTTRIFLSEVGFAVPFEAEPPEPFDIGPLPTIPELRPLPTEIPPIPSGDGGDPCIPTGAVWSDTKSFTGSKEEVIAAVSRVALRNCSGCSPRN